MTEDEVLALAAEMGRATRREMERLAVEAGMTPEQAKDYAGRVTVYIGSLDGWYVKHG